MPDQWPGQEESQWPGAELQVKDIPTEGTVTFNTDGSVAQPEQWPGVDETKVADHVAVKNNVAARSNTLNTITGSPNDSFQNEVNGWSRAQQIVPLNKDEAMTAEQIDKVFGKAKEGPSVPELLAKSNEEQHQKSFQADIAKGQLLLDKLNQPLSSEQTTARNKPEWFYGPIPNIEMASEYFAQGETKAVTGSVQALQMIARLTPAGLKAQADAMAYRKALLMLPPDKAKDLEKELGTGYGQNKMIQSLKTFGDWLDQRSNTVPDYYLQSQNTFGAKLFSQLGALPVLVASGGVLGKYGLAAMLALQNGDSVSKTATQLAIKDGKDPATAEMIGTGLGAATLPLSYILNIFNPLSKLAGGDEGSTSRSVNVLLGSGQMGIVNTAQHMINSAITPIVSDPLHRDSLKVQAYGYSMLPSGEDTAISLISGGLIGAMTEPRRISVEETLKNINIVPDSLNRQELHRQIKDELGLKDERFQVAAAVFDAVAMEKARRMNVPVEEVYAQHVADIRDRGASGQVVQFNQAGNLPDLFSALDQLLNSSKFHQSFGDKPADPSAILAFLKANGAKQDELNWTGFNSLFEEAAKANSDENTATPVKFSKKDLQEYFNKNQVRVLTVMRKSKGEANETQTALNDLYRQQHEIETKMTAETDPQKREEIHQQFVGVTQGINELQLKLRAYWSEPSTKWDSIVAPGPATGYEEWVIRVPFGPEEFGMVKEGETEKVKFQGAHFDDPNYFVHVRLDNRMTDKGPSWVVQEVQSDWHQQGRELGYKEPGKIEQLSKLYEEKHTELKQTVQKRSDEQLRLEGQYGRPLDNLKDYASELRKLYASEQRITDEVLDIKDQMGKLEDAPEPGPFSHSWVDLALKKILLEAVNRNIPRVSFVSGDLSDRFQGVVDEQQSLGRKKFYDEILPQRLKEVLRKEWGVKQGMEVVNIATQDAAVKDAMTRGDFPKEWTSPILSLEITPTLREKVYAKGGATMFQPNRASVTFLENGKAFLKGLENPDFTSAMHEFAHIFLRGFLTPEDLNIAANQLNVKDGFWQRDHEETFARLFERFMMNGQAPNAQLRGVFKDASDYMKEIYKKGTELGVEVSPRMQEVFDRLFVADNDPVRAARRNLDEVTRNHISAQMELEQKGTEANKLKVADAMNKLHEAKVALEESKASNLFSRTNYSRPELMAQYTRAMLDSFTDTPAERAKFRDIKGAWRQINQFLYQRAKAIMDNAVGRQHVEYMLNATHDFWQMQGRFNASRDAVLRSLSPEDQKTIGTIDKNGDSGARRLLELGTQDPVSPGLKNFKELGRVIFDAVTHQELQNNVLRELSSGDTPPAIASTILKMPHLMTPFGRSLMQGKEGSLGLEYLELQQRRNPDAKNLNADTLFTELRRRGANPAPTQGSIEGTRTLDLSDGFIGKDGKQYNVFHNNAADLLNRWIDRSFQRITQIKFTGQQLLKDVADPKSAQYYERWRTLASLNGAVVGEFSVNAIRQNLVEQGWKPESVKGMTKTQLVEASKGLGVMTRTPIEDLMKVVDTLRVSQMTGDQGTELRKLAKEVGGIDSRGPIEVVLQQVRDRMNVRVEDDLLGLVKKKYQAAGGDPSRIDKFMEVWNGVMGGDSYNLENPLIRWSDNVLNVVNMLATSAANVKHIAQVARFSTAHVGPLEMVKTVLDTMFNYGTKEASNEQFERLSRWGMTQQSKTPWGVTNTGRQLRSAVTTGTGMGPLMQFNGTLAAEFGRGIAEKWVNGGFKDSDKGLALRLRLNQGEIEMLKQGGITLGEKRIDMTENDKTRLFEKIVREFQAMNLGGEYEAPQNRSIVESNPWTRKLLGWQRFATTAVKDFFGTLGEFKTGLLSGDPVVSGKAGYKLLLWVGALLGTHTLTHMLVNKVKAVPPNDEDGWDGFFGALAETAVFGMPTSFINTYRFSNGNTERFVLGFIPQINSIAQLVSTIAGQGKYGDLPLPERVEKAFLNATPAAKAVNEHINQTMYPSIVDYQEVRVKQRRWEKAQPGAAKGVPSDEPMNPDYYHVFLDVQRNDPVSASEEMAKYLRHETEKQISLPPDEQKTLEKMIEDIRLSLMNRRPMNLQENRALHFMQTLKPEDRVKVQNANQRYMDIVNVVAPNKGNAQDR